MSSHFNLDTALAAWRRSLTYNRAFDADDLDELERHVRDQVEALVARGMSQEEAFHRALREMGRYGAVETEYRKVYWGKRRRRGEMLRELIWRGSMLKNYLKIAYRNLLRRKGYAFINIFGLAAGLACFVLILLFVQHELSYDRFHEKADRIYRLAISQVQNEGEPVVAAQYGHGAAPAFAEEVPEIERYARIYWDYFQEGPTISYQDAGVKRVFKDNRALYADPELLELFTFPLVQGDAATALQQPGTLLLTERAARTFFGDADPIGKTLEYTSVAYVQGTYTVAGVLKDPPANSHLQFDVLLPMQDLLAMYGADLHSTGRYPDDTYTAYVELQEDAAVRDIEQKLTDALYRLAGDYFEERNVVAAIDLQPLSSVYFDRTTIVEHVATGNARIVYFFTVIALIILAIALVNYVNLSTARALSRGKEVGVRKVVGARRGQLVGQFLLESVLINLVALGMALVLAATLTPLVNQLFQTQLTSAIWTMPRSLLAFGGVFALGVVLSGLYPAFVLSSFRPAHILKGHRASAASRGTLRKGLVVLQFTGTVVLLTCTGVIYSQLDYMRNLDVGLDLERILVVTSPKVLPEGMDAPTAETTFKNEVTQLAAVRGAAFSGNLVGRGFNVSGPAFLDGMDPSLAPEVRVTGADHAFAELYGLELVAGEPFHEDMPSWFAGPADMPRPVLINEAAVQALGLPDPEAALGRRMTVGSMRYVVQGVLSDFNWSSVHEPTEAVLFRYLPNNRFLSLKIAAGDVQRTVAAVRDVYERLFPDDLFQYQFADAVYDAQYREDARFTTLFGIFTGLAILIACLGLFGLASFTAERRTKEIGVRKVLGASVAGIVALLSKDFLKLVSLAVIIATPVAYVAMQRWLDDFAYRIELSWPVFLVAGLAALGIALLTVSYQAVKAALADPVKSLRYE